MIEKDLESSLDYTNIWPSLKDLYGMKKSENPLIFAKNIFEQCNNLLHARITLKKKDLKLLNEVGIKLMENLDSLCAASDERKLLIKDINIFCDHIDQKINEKDNENQGDDNFDCQICRLSFLTEKELVNHVNIHALKSSGLTTIPCTQCQNMSFLPICIYCKNSNEKDTPMNSENIPKSPTRIAIKKQAITDVQRTQ